MKLAVHHIIIAAMALVIAILSWALIYVSRDQLQLHEEEYEEEIETVATASFDNGRAIVRVSQQSQQASGIRVTALQAASHKSALQVYGGVVDIEPLLELRGRYLSAVGELGALRADLVAAQTELKRARVLFEDDRNISEQALRQAESRSQLAQARLSAAQASVSMIRDSLHAAWGPTVGAWAMDPQSAALNALLARRTALVQLVFPYELPGAAARPRLMLAPVAAQARAVEARFVSAAPRSSAALPGNTFFYSVKGADLRAGARVVADVSVEDTAFDGVVVPNDAVVWHAGKAWAYRKQDEETFGRYEISVANELGNGWFQRGDLRPGDEVVVSGAQLLLSEELKFQIRNENED